MNLSARAPNFNDLSPFQAVILTYLLQNSDSSSVMAAPAHPDSLDTVRRAILDWVMKIADQGAKSKKPETHDIATDSDDQSDNKQDLEREVSDILWQKEHCKLLAQVSARYFDFFKAHFQFLAKKTKRIERTQLEAYALEQCKDEETSNGVATPSLAQQVEWATSHWVELVLTGGQVRDTCISFLSKEAEQPVSNKDSTYAAITMMVPARESVWHELLSAIQHAIEK